MNVRNKEGERRKILEAYSHKNRRYILHVCLSTDLHSLPHGPSTSRLLSLILCCILSAWGMFSIFRAAVVVGLCSRTRAS